MPRSFKWSLSFIFIHQNPVCISVLPSMCYLPRPSHTFLSDHPDNIWWVTHSLKFVIMQFFPLTFVHTPLRPKYISLQHILEHRQCMFFCERERPSFALAESNRQKALLDYTKMHFGSLPNSQPCTDNAAERFKNLHTNYAWHNG